MDVTNPRFRVALARRMLFRSGCDTGIAQHVSERDPAGDAVWVSALDHGDMATPGTVAKFDLAGQQLEPGDDLDPPLEYAPDYVELYRRRPDVRAVVHSHSFWTMVLCTQDRTVGLYTTRSSLLAGEQVSWADDPFAPGPRGERLADAIGDRRILLMRNHGLVVAAESLEEAVVLATVVEEEAHLSLEAAARGGREMPEAHVGPTRKAHRRTYVRQTWAANVRRMKVTDADLFAYSI